MKMITLTINFKEIDSEEELHNKFKQLFGFPDSYNNSFDSFISCFNNIRNPLTNTTSLSINDDESIVFEIDDIFHLSDKLKRDFLLAIEKINNKQVSVGKNALIILLLYNTFYIENVNRRYVTGDIINMDSVTLSINFEGVKEEKEFHTRLKDLFGFPDFYGANYYALVDCLGGLKIPEDEMSLFTIKKNEYVLLETNNINQLPDDVMFEFISAIVNINDINLSIGKKIIMLLQIN